MIDLSHARVDRAKEQLRATLRHIKQVATATARSEASDGELLERFVTRHEEQSFAALLQRHGPMVLAVCRRSLQAQDVEDVFQATFLLLASKVDAIGPYQGRQCCQTSG